MNEIEQDVSGMIFTVQKAPEGFKLSTDEWYPVTLVSIVKNTNEKLKFGPMLDWNFELEGDEYTVEYDGIKKQRKLRGSTGISFVPKSKLFVWYSKLQGSEPNEGDQITLKPFIGRKYWVMVETTKGKDGKTYNNVEKIKPRTDTSSKVAPFKPSVVKPEPTVSQETPKASTQTKNTDTDIFDIF